MQERKALIEAEAASIEVGSAGCGEDSLTQHSLRVWVLGCIWHLVEGGSVQTALYCAAASPAL